MKIAIVGCRHLNGYSYDDFCQEVPQNTTRIISGGAMGIDDFARRYARQWGIDYQEFLPDYDSHPGRIAPILRNREIVAAADFVLAFWDGKSRGTRSVIGMCIQSGTPYRVVDIATGHSLHV